MMQKLSPIWLKPWSTLIGIILGVAMVLWAPTWLAPMLASWDKVFPVITPVKSEVVDRFGDEVWLNVTAYKRRGEECRLIRIYGYGIDTSGGHTIANVRRPDGTEHAGIVHGEGLHHFGLWSVKPTDPSAVKVEVWVEHNCLGRVIRSLMAEVKLK